MVATTHSPSNHSTYPLISTPMFGPGSSSPPDSPCLGSGDTIVEHLQGRNCAASQWPVASFSSPASISHPLMPIHSPATRALIASLTRHPRPTISSPFMLLFMDGRIPASPPLPPENSCAGTRARAAEGAVKGSLNGSPHLSRGVHWIAQWACTLAIMHGEADGTLLSACAVISGGEGKDLPRARLLLIASCDIRGVLLW